ncbi:MULTISPECIES: ligand-binding sensor domain-containing protein [Chitinophagaceae]
MLRVWIACFVLLLNIGRSVHCQNLYFRHYQVENGLSNNSVITVLQDRYGFVWFGTSDGLNRFDGNSVQVFRHIEEDTSSISGSSVYCLCEDKTGHLFVGTGKGLCVYRPFENSFARIKEVPSMPIRSMCVDKNNQLWLIVENELYSYRIATREFRKIPLTGMKVVTSIAENKEDGVWVGSADGNMGLLKNGKLVLCPITTTTQNSIETILNYAPGRVMVGTSKEGCLLYDVATKQQKCILNAGISQPELFVRGILQLSDSTFFVSTETGLYLYNLLRNTFQHFTKDVSNPFSLTDNALYGLCKDREGGIWIGSYFGGVNYLPNQRIVFQKYFPTALPNALGGSAIREIVKDNSGMLWIGSEDGGLTKFDVRKQVFQKVSPNYTNGLSGFNIHGLLPVGDKLFVGTFEQGMDVMDLKSQKVIYHIGVEDGRSGLKSNFIDKIFKTSRNQIILCTARGAYYFHPSDRKCSPVGHFDDDIFFSAITEDHRANIWLGTHTKGLYRMDSSGVVTEVSIYDKSGRSVFRETRILYILEDMDHQLWVATISGLYCVNVTNGAYKVFNTSDGLPSDIVYCIVQDNYKNYWITTSQGLVQLDNHTGKLNIYKQSNGILNDQFNYQSAFKDTNGDIYLGSIKGLIKFNPDRVQAPAYSPPLYFTGIHFSENGQQFDPQNYSGQALEPLDQVVLKSSQSTFRISFAALSYTAPSNILYAYRINDSVWYNIGTARSLSFVNLAAGDYKLTLRSTNSEGVWMSNEKTLSMRVLPRFWQSKPAYILYFLFFIALNYAVVKYYNRRQKEKQFYKMQLFAFNKEKELYISKMDFYTHVAHEIKTPLTLIKVPLERVLKSIDDMPHLRRHLEIINNNTGRLYELTNQLLDFRKSEIEQYHLEFVEVDMGALVQQCWTEYLPLMEKRNIHASVECPKTGVILEGNKDALQKIINNLIDNAIKYCQRSIVLKLEMDREQNLVSLTVQNDGALIPEAKRGTVFEPFSRYHSNIPGSGIGLSFAYLLAQLHKGTLQYIPENGRNKFELGLPIKQSI